MSEQENVKNRQTLLNLVMQYQRTVTDNVHDIPVYRTLGQGHEAVKIEDKVSVMMI